MIEIKNKTRGPVQLLIRSKQAPRQFTTINIPGIGKDKNTIFIEEEKIVQEILDRVVKLGMISTRYIPNKKVKGD